MLENSVKEKLRHPARDAGLGLWRNGGVKSQAPHLVRGDENGVVALHQGIPLRFQPSRPNRAPSLGLARPIPCGRVPKLYAKVLV